MLLIQKLTDSKAFPFDPNPNWSRFYSSGAEIEQYILDTTRKWNLDRDVKLGHDVIEARWMEDLGQWKLVVEHAGQRQTHYVDVLLSGQGVLVYVGAVESTLKTITSVLIFRVIDIINTQMYLVSRTSRAMLRIQLIGSTITTIAIKESQYVNLLMTHLPMS